MKKFLSFPVIFAVLMTAFAFTSCSDDDANISVIINNGQNGTTFAEGAPIIGVVTSDNRVNEIIIERQDGNLWQPYRTIARTNFQANGIHESEGHNLALMITGVTAGTFNIQAVDNSGNRSNRVEFTVGEQAPAIDWSTGRSTITANGTYAFRRAGGQEGTLVVTDLGLTSVRVQLGSHAAVTLSQDGHSWLMTTGLSSNQADAIASAGNILLAKRANAAEIVDYRGTTAGAGGQITGAQTVVFVRIGN